jgi:phytoene desaturase
MSGHHEMNPESEKRKVIVIGAGIGGIATAGYLAGKGYHVTIFEKNAYPGGRCGRYEKDGHRFDIGATFLMMPGIYEEAFAAVGKSLFDELILHRVDPVYKVKFKGSKQVLFTSDLATLQKQFEGLERGSFNRFLKLMSRGFDIYEKSMRLIARNYFRILDPSLLKYPFLLVRYKAFNNHYRYISRYFRTEELRAFFTFQNLYLGQDPFAASGMYAFLPFMELADGVYFPEGGMHEVAESLLSVAREQGVQLHLNSPVTRIEVDGNRAKGIVLNDCSFHPADMIVSNADLPYVYNHLLPKSRRARRLNRKRYSCSAIVFHWGVDRVYPQLKQHTVFVSGTHRESCRTIFRDHGFAREPSIYVHSPVRSDPSAAPENQDSITAIVHAGNLDDTKEYDWEGIKSGARNAILERFEEEGLTGFGKHIKFEICFTPDRWRSEFNLTRGGTFGSLAHNLLQMGFLRPGNHHRKYRNLYFAGGSTQPGSGMPLSLLSAKLVSERIERDNRNPMR